MSREYFVKIFFDKPYPRDKFGQFFSNWCGWGQILKIGSSAVTCEMGCSGGVHPEDAMNELYNALVAEGFKVDKENIIAWSLHPDNAIHIGGENE